jgi:hypothetical protein
MSIYQKVANSEMSADDGAKLLMDERRAGRAWSLRQPDWMPRWLYVVAVVTFAIMLAPVLSVRDSRS